MISAHVRCWRDDPALALASLAARLPAADRDELRGIRGPERARSFVLSRLLLRQTLGAALGHPGRELRFGRASGGRLLALEAAPWHISLSHCPGLVAVIVATAPCGIDIEPVRPFRVDRLARRYFAASEVQALAACSDEGERLNRFFRLWTLKEASVKALHQGLAGNLGRLAFSLEGATPRLLADTPALQLQQTLSDRLVLAAAVATAAGVSWHWPSAPAAPIVTGT